MNEKIQQAMATLNNALNRLHEVAIRPLGPQKDEVDLVVHRFEFTFELFWKTLRKILEHEFGIMAHGAKPVLQQAYAAGLIDDEKVWLAMLEDRNLISHMYQEALAFQIYQRIKEYEPVLRQTFDNIVVKSQNDWR